MPVGRDYRKVQRDTAEIDVKGKVVMSMGLGFLGAFIF